MNEMEGEIIKATPTVSIVDGKCDLCGKPVKVTKHNPPLEGDDEDGHYWLLDTYGCDSCGIDQEHKVRKKNGKQIARQADRDYEG